MDKRTLFFDYDGTLHNSIKIYYPAFLKAFDYLISQRACENRLWTEDEVSKWLGFNKEEMWDAFMPTLDSELKDLAGNIIGKRMDELVLQGEAELFPNVAEILYLIKKDQFELIFLSNCSNSYMERHRDLFKLDRFFDAYYTAEQFDYISKADILTKVVEKHPNPRAVIGDRLKDFDAAKANNLLSIGCSYGYGTKEELNKADIVIDRFDELLTIIRPL